MASSAQNPHGRSGDDLDRLLRRPRHAPTAPASGERASDLAPFVALATRVGAIALVAGASAAEATQSILRMAMSRGGQFQVDVTFTSVMVSGSGGDEEPPVTMVRTVPALAHDYARLGHLNGVVDAVCSGELDIREATRLLKEREETGREYRRWVLLLAAFVQGAAICALLGGDLLEMAVAGLATFLIGVLGLVLRGRRVSYFFAQVAAGAIPMVLAMLMMYLRQQGIDGLWALSPSLVVASGMVSMLAGMGVVAAAQDALDGYFITAGARVVELLMRTGGLILGVAGVLWLGVRIGAPAYLAAQATPMPHPVVQVVSAGLFTLGLGVASGLGPRGALVVAGFGSLGWVAYLLVLTPVGGEYPLAAGVAAAVVGFLGHLLARRLGPPAIAIVTVGIAPLMPGMFLYRALFRLVVGVPAVDPGDSAPELLMLSALTGIGLALGSSVGAVIGRQLSLPTDRVARLATLFSLRRGLLRRH